MYKTKVSIALSLVFVLFLAAPTLITVFHVSADTSVFFSITEEENETKNVVKHINVNIASNVKIPFCLELSDPKTPSFYVVSSIPSWTFKTVSPPPEHVI